MTTIDQQALESARRIHDPLALSAVAAQFRQAAAREAATATSQARTVEVWLTIDPHTAQHTLDSIAVLIAGGDVHAASLAVVA